MREVLATQSLEPHQPLLFPQEFQKGEGSSEMLQAHIELAGWTIGALEQAIQHSSDARETEIKNDRNAVSGTRLVLEQQLSYNK